MSDEEPIEVIPPPHWKNFPDQVKDRLYGPRWREGIFNEGNQVKYLRSEARAKAEAAARAEAARIAAAQAKSEQDAYDLIHLTPPEPTFHSFPNGGIDTTAEDGQDLDASDYLRLSVALYAENERTQHAGPARRRPSRAWPLYDLRVLMERPFLALAGKPIAALPPYRSPDGRLSLHVVATDPARGVATIRDADILIYLVSLLDRRLKAEPERALNHQGDAPALIVNVKALLEAVGRPTGGRQRQLLLESLDRLSGSIITTNIRPDGSLGATETFALVSGWERLAGRPGLRVVLSDWIVEAVSKAALLDLSPDYFALRPGYERWLYRVARKHAGSQVEGWKVRVGVLHSKSGIVSPLTRFRSELRRVIETTDFPEYEFAWIERPTRREDDVVWMRPKSNSRRARYERSRQRHGGEASSPVLAPLREVSPEEWDDVT